MKVFVRLPRIPRPKRGPARRRPREDGEGTTHELFDTPAYRVLRTMLKETHENPRGNGAINMRRFTEASGHAPRHAKKLREQMSELDVIHVHPDPKERDAGDEMQITLTTKGRKVAERSVEIERVLGDEPR